MPAARPCTSPSAAGIEQYGAYGKAFADYEHLMAHWRRLRDHLAPLLALRPED